MPADILPFRPSFYPDAREFVSADGRRWCARSYMPADRLHLLTHGRSYTPAELVCVYGLYTRDEEPGFYLRHDEAMPDRVEYRVHPLCSGEE